MSGIGGEGGGPIESAFIEITADTDAAEKGIREVDQDLRVMDELAEQIAENISLQFRQTGEILSRAFEEAKDATTRDLVRINRAITENFGEGVTRAKHMIAGIDEPWERARRATSAQLLRINRNIATAFDEGAADAKESIGDIPQAFERARMATTAQLFRINRNISTAFQEGTASAAESIGDIGRAWEKPRMATTAQLLRINRAVTKAFQEAALSADESLGDIGGESLVGLQAQVAQVTALIASAFGIASNQADAELREIGGADAFAGAVFGARAAGAGITSAFSNAGFRARIAIGGISLGITSAVAGLAVLGGAMVAFGTTSTAQIELVETAFAGLLGSEEAAEQTLDSLFNLAAETPFEIQGLADTTAKLLSAADAMGLNRNEIFDTITVMGDITTALGQPVEAVDRLQRAFGQMAARGQVMTEELIQISEALPGFPVFDELAQGLGVTTEELDELLREGLVPSKEAIDILLTSMRQFPGAAGAMERASQTLIGLFSTLKDEVRFTLIDAFEPFTNNLRDTLRDAVGIVENSVGLLAGPLNDLATSALRGFLSAIDVLVPAIASALEYVVRLGGALRPVGGQLLEAGGAIIRSLGPALESVGRLLEPVLQLVADLGQSEFPQLIRIVGEVATSLEPMVNILAELIGVVLPVLVQLLDLVPAPVLAAVLAFVQFNRVMNATRLAISGFTFDAKKLGVAFTPVGAAIAVATLALGAYATKQAEARAQARAIDQQIQSFSETLGNADNAIEGMRNALEQLVKSGEDVESTLKLAQLSATDTLQILGLTANDTARLFEQGSDAVMDFALSMDDGSNASAVAGANLVALSDNMQAAAKQTLQAKVQLEDFTQAEVDAALEANTAKDGTVNYIGAVNDLQVAHQQSEAAIRRETEAQNDRRAAMEAAATTNSLFGDSIRAIKDGVGSVSTEMATLAVKIDAASLSEEELGAISAELGISLTDLGYFTSVATRAVETFSGGIEATFPSIASAIGELDNITFDNLLETFRETFEAAVNFEANLATLAAYPNVQAAAAQAGPEVAAALAAGFKDGKTQSLEEMELLAQGTQTTFDNTLAASQTWGINLAASAYEAGHGANVLYGQGFTVQTTSAQRMSQARVNIQNAKDGIRSAASTAGSQGSAGFASGSSGIASSARTNMASARQAIKDQAGNVYSDGYSVGSQLAAGASAGIASGIGSVIQQARNLVARARNAARDEAGITSPSKVFMEIGGYMGEGMALGMAHETARVAAAGESLAAAAEAGVAAGAAARNSQGSGAGGGGDVYDITVNVTGVPGMSDAELRRQGTKQGDALSAVLERRRVRTETRISG